MKCPKCESPWHVTSEADTCHNDNLTITRKRECASCGHKWFTAEVSVHPANAGFTTRYGGYKKRDRLGVKDEVLQQLSQMAMTPPIV